MSPKRMLPKFMLLKSYFPNYIGEYRKHNIIKYLILEGCLFLRYQIL